MLVNLPEGPVLLAGDVAWMERSIAAKAIGVPFISVSGKGARRSLGSLLRFIEQNPGVTVVPGHDLGPLVRAKRGDVVVRPWPAS